MTGSGNDIGDPTGDAFHFVWQPLAGNGTLSARITSQTTPGAWTKAGLLLRASTDPLAPFYNLAVIGGTFQVNVRTTQGGGMGQPAGGTLTLPTYLQVVRVGATVTAYTSTDGLAWVPIPHSGVTFAAGALPATALAGLAVDSNNASQTSTAQFDTVSVGAYAWNTSLTSDVNTAGRPAVALGQDGQIYQFGGETSIGSYSSSTVIYNPATNTWSQGAPVPLPGVEGAQALTLPNGDIAVLGGGVNCDYSNTCSSGVVSATVEVYNPISDTWNTDLSIPAMPHKHYQFAAARVGSQLYAIGGSDGTGASAAVDMYDLTTGKWQTVAALPYPIEGAAATVDAQGRIDLFGGFDGGNTHFDTFWQYSGGQWTAGPRLPLATGDAGATIGPDGKVYVFGGYNENYGYLSAVQVFDPNANGGAWAMGPALPAPTLGMGAVTLPTGQLVALTGYNGGSPVPATSQVAFYGPSIGLTPDGGIPGGATTLHGSGFAPGGAVAVTWGGVGGLPATQLTATADLTGSIAATLTVPTTVTQGLNTLMAQDVESGYPVTTSYAGGGLTWNTTLTSLPAYRLEPAVALGQDGSIYAIGGTPGGNGTNTTYIYHPATDSWTPGATLPYTVTSAKAATLPDGRLMVFGGGPGCDFTTQCAIYTQAEAYSPSTNSWAPLAPMHTPRYDFATATLGGQVYAIGGWTGSGNTASMERYDPVARTWDTTATNGQPIPPFTSAPGSPGYGLEGMAAAAGPDGRIYVAGGLANGGPDGRSGTFVRTVYIYDPASNSWALGPALPKALGDVSAAPLNATLGPDGRVYVIGGYDGIQGRFDLHYGGTAAVTAINPRTLTWTPATALPYGTNGTGVVTTANGQLFVVGGSHGTPVAIGTVTFAEGGSIPWHPHQSVRMSDGLNATVDLADGHVDVSASDLSIPARGPDLSLSHTWDSVRALNGDATTAGQGWNTDLSPSMGGVLTQTVSYTDSAGTRWLFPYYGSTSGSGPYSQYDIPPGQPWALSTSPITGYTLANILTGATLSFDAQGRLQADTDAYGNSNTLTAGTNQPTSETNSGGRALAFTYTGNGQLADAQSPLWQAGGASAAGSQHVAYGYNPQGQLTTLTRGAGTPDALTETFGYNGAELVTVTTPYTQSPHT